jgi:origin recognition complex subunit 2
VLTVSRQIRDHHQTIREEGSIGFIMISPPSRRTISNSPTLTVHQQETMGAGSMFSETAALHILASVNQKARKLFELMANKQLESIDSIEGEGDVAAEKGVEPSTHLQLHQQQQPHLHAIGYDALFNLARAGFIATNDTALRSLLGEFRDHGLVLAGAGSGGAAGAAGGGEVLWIPMRKERLLKVLGSMQTQ